MSAAGTTTTPGLTEYGSEKSYLALRSSLIETWFAITSKRSPSRPANIASHWVSSNSGSTPSFSATAVITSTSYPVRSPVPPSAWYEKG